MVLDVCRASAANGLDAMVVSMGGGRLEQEFADSGVEFVRLRRRMPLDLQCVHRLRSIIRKRNVAVVHSHQAVETIHSLFATMGTPAKRVQTIHGYAYDLKTRAALRFLMPRVDANIAVSSSFLDIFRQTYHPPATSRFVVVDNGVDPAKLDAKTPLLRTELGMKHDEILAGMVANFWRWKDQLTVCTALNSVLAEVPNLKFVFVGSKFRGAPYLYENCVRYCKAHDLQDRVFFLGERSDVGNILHSLDLFVLSSVQDTFGIAVVEAMIAGIPTLISDIPPFVEISRNGKWSRLFKVGNPTDLATQLIDLLSHPQEAKLLANTARAGALQEYTIDRHISRLKDLYGSLAGQ